MKKWGITLILLWGLSGNILAKDLKQDQDFSKPLYKPFIERYILDEIKSLRMNEQQLRADVERRVAQAELDTADRAITYTTDTVNNIFFIITGAASILVLMGWSSLREIRSKIEAMVNERVDDVTQRYEERLDLLEKKLRDRTDQIIAAQEEISKANTIHSLWMRAGLETSAKERINLYDEILRIKPEDIEAITYKADSVLEMGKCEWALNLADHAIELDPEYGLAYWQRACAEAELNLFAEAVDDIKLALEKTPGLKLELGREDAFKKMYNEREFAALLESIEG